MSNANSSLFKGVGVVLKIVGAVCLIVLFLGFLLWLGLAPGSDTKRSMRLRDEIIERVHQAKLQRGIVVINLDRLANFDWDTLWIFPGYSEYGKIAARTGYRPNLLCYGEVNENAQLIVFTFKGKTVDHISSLSDKGTTLEFDDLTDPRSFSRDKARFRVQFDCQRDNWDFYRCDAALTQN